MVLAINQPKFGPIDTIMVMMRSRIGISIERSVFGRVQMGVGSDGGIVNGCGGNELGMVRSTCGMSSSSIKKDRNPLL